MHTAVSLSSPHITAAPLKAWIRQAGLRLMTWFEDRAARAGDAALYQELSKLSDTELERLGIPRGELHRCVSGAALG